MTAFRKKRPAHTRSVFQFRSQRKYQSRNASWYRSKYLVTVATTVAAARAAVIAIVAATTVVTRVANGRAACVVAAAKVA
jgi:glycine cleavage system H lipoate-binding protein